VTSQIRQKSRRRTYTQVRLPRECVSPGHNGQSAYLSHRSTRTLLQLSKLRGFSARGAGRWRQARELISLGFRRSGREAGGVVFLAGVGGASMWDGELCEIPE